MQRHLCLCDLDDSITTSLKADIESLADEIRQLEQAWKQSLLTSAAACHHGDRPGDCEPSGGCAGNNETPVSEYRHCDKTLQVVCEPSDNCASDTVDMLDSRYDRTCQVDEHGFLQTDQHLDKALDSDCSDSIVRQTVQTNMHLHTCRELTTCNKAVKGGASLSICDTRGTDANVQGCTSITCDVCREFLASARVDAFFTDQLQLSQYKSCCSKLDKLFSVFLSLSK